MTGIAFQVGVYVLRPFALRLYIVVTGGAAAASFRMVEINRGVPCDGRMAALAALGRQNVIGCLGRGTDSRTDSMAGATIPGSPLENGVCMTGLAGKVPMLAYQLETCGEMVEKVTQLHRERGVERERRYEQK